MPQDLRTKPMSISSYAVWTIVLLLLANLVLSEPAASSTIANDHLTGVGNAITSIVSGTQNVDAFAVASGILTLGTLIPGPVGLLCGVAGILLSFFGPGDKTQAMIQKALQDMTQFLSKLESEVDKLEVLIQQAFHEVRYEIRQITFRDALRGLQVLQLLYNSTISMPSRALVFDYVQACRLNRVTYGPEGIANFLLSDAPRTLKEFLILYRPFKEFLRFAHAVTMAYTQSTVLFFSCSVLMNQLSGGNISYTDAAFSKSVNDTYKALAEKVIYETNKKVCLTKGQLLLTNQSYYEVSDIEESKNETSLPKSWTWFSKYKRIDVNPRMTKVQGIREIKRLKNLENLNTSADATSPLEDSQTYYFPPSLINVTTPIESLSESVWFLRREHISEFAAEEQYFALVQILTEERKRKRSRAEDCMNVAQGDTCEKFMNSSALCIDKIELKYYIGICFYEDLYSNGDPEIFVARYNRYKFQSVFILYDDDFPTTKEGKGIDFLTVFRLFPLSW